VLHLLKKLILVFFLFLLTIGGGYIVYALSNHNSGSVLGASTGNFALISCRSGQLLIQSSDNIWICADNPLSELLSFESKAVVNNPATPTQNLITSAGDFAAISLKGSASQSSNVLNVLSPSGTTVFGVSPGGNISAGTVNGIYLSSQAGVPALINGNLSYDSAINKFKIVENGAVKTLCNTSDVCGAGSTSWSLLTNPSSNLSLGMGNTASTFTWGAVTGGGNQFTFTDSTNNSGTGSILNLATASGSSASPLNVSAAGTNALYVGSNGNVGIGNKSPTNFKLEVSGNFGPSLTNVYDLGNNFNRFKTLFLSTGGIDFMDQFGNGGSITSGTGDILTLANFTEFAFRDNSFTRFFNIASAPAAGSSAPLLYLNPVLKALQGNNTVSGLQVSFSGVANSGSNNNLYGIKIDNLSALTNVTKTGLAIGTGWDYSATFAGNVGIGNTTPTTLLSIGATQQFQVNATGNLTKINNISYSWPAIQGTANSVLINDGIGNLTWTSAAPFLTAFVNGGNSYAGNASLGTNNNFALIFETNNQERVRILNTGEVGIGTFTPTAGYLLDVNGKIRAASGFNGTCRTDANVTAGPICNQDVAEIYKTDEPLETGDIVSINTDSGNVTRSKVSADSTLIGIVSTSPGLVFDNGNTQLAGSTSNYLQSDKAPIALSGKVPTKVSSINGSIKKGDLITSSSKKGIGQKATTTGFIIGKALEDYNETDINKVGKILVFVNLSYFVSTADLAKLSNSDILNIDLSINPSFQNINNKLNMLQSSTQIGDAKLKAETISLRVNFPNNFGIRPIVNITPNSLVESSYYISDVNPIGFTIRLKSPQRTDVKFSWQAAVKY